MFEPTFGQKKVIEALGEFIAGSDPEPIFMLNGYAGTGKTSLISALVGALKTLKIKPVLLAPTGRAAKVMTQYSGTRASTIHKKIYRQKSLTSPEAGFSIDFNPEKDAVFIVDEVSMLSNQTGDYGLFGSDNLLDDLISYVRRGARCRLIVVGDSAQLPPVGLDISPALDPREMGVYGEVIPTGLDEVVRQEADSGILFNATMVRMMLEAGIIDIPIFDTSFADVEAIEGGELLDALDTAYGRYGREETIVITRSNKRANKFNEGIRANVLYMDEEISGGDMLMVVKNNYHYTERIENCPMDFIANGDIARLTRVRKFQDLYGFRFAEAFLVFDDYDSTEVECKILLDTLSSESPSLSREQSSALYYSVAEDYAHLTTKAKRAKEIRENPYFNAVQVKFAYAVTCHKAQGGQWRCVFVDRMLFGDEQMSRDMMRWLYTAMTRATEKLYFVNFDERFFENK